MLRPAWIGRLSVPALAAPMFAKSNPNLVACRGAGVVGAFAALRRRGSGGYEARLGAIETRLADFPDTAGLCRRLARDYAETRKGLRWAAAEHHAACVEMKGRGATLSPLPPESRRQHHCRQTLPPAKRN